MSGIIAQNSGRHTGLVKASSGGGGVWNLIKTYTASSDSDLSFVEGTDGIDFTAYDEFVFKFIDIHPETDNVTFQVNFRDGSTAYDATKTTTVFRAYHNEADAVAILGYRTGSDLAQSTAVQKLNGNVGSDNDQCLVGTLTLYAPSSTTFVKHFISRTNVIKSDDQSQEKYVAGYCNVTAAIDGVQFTMSTDSIQSGQISLYGIS